MGCLGFAPDVPADDVIRRASDLERAVYVDAQIGRPFSLDVKVSILKSPRLFFTDETGAMCADVKRQESRQSNLRPGHVVRLKGHIILSSVLKIPVADCESVEMLGKAETPAPEPFTPDGWNAGRLDFRPVTLSGSVADIYNDEADPRFRIFVLNCGNARVQVSVNQEECAPELAADVLGREVHASGICNPVVPMARIFGGRTLELIRQSDIELLPTPPADLFAGPPLLPFQRIGTEQDGSFGRRRVTGRVLAVYRDSHALLLIDRQQTIDVDFATPPPRTGDTIEATGFPAANGFIRQLRRAHWRSAENSTVSPPEDGTRAAPAVKIRELLRDRENHTYFNRKFNGLPISVTGTVRMSSTAANGTTALCIEDDGLILSVETEPDVGLPEEVAVGTKVEVRGVFLTIVESSQIESILPRMRDCLLSLQRASDLRIVRRPPWWTPTRLATAIALLAILLLGALVWNTALRRLAERRGNELTQNRLAAAEAEIKTMERTRLAVELHDSLAQNLTGIALELQTVDVFHRKDPDRARDHLARATRSLLSCRQELRNCLWDLRSDALGKSSMDEAIAVMLEPLLGNVTCAIRFAIPRARLTENTTLTILKIIRELVLNAIRHGKASQVKVAGAVEGDSWHVSVKDNGCGFNPDDRPGVREGHFGLQGVRERVQSLGGTLEIESTPGKGARVSFMAPWPHLAGDADTNPKESRK